MGVNIQVALIAVLSAHKGKATRVHPERALHVILKALITLGGRLGDKVVALELCEQGTQGGALRGVKAQLAGEFTERDARLIRDEGEEVLNLYAQMELSSGCWMCCVDLKRCLSGLSVV
jgi:hypothetical protein